jgi:hypothetical protein
MDLNDAPAKLPIPFCDIGGKNAIPESSGVFINSATLEQGFPAITRTDLVAGGVPPDGLDMNGILNEMSAIDRWSNAGAGYLFDSVFAASVGGYPKGSKVLFSDSKGYWLSTTDSNSTDPEVGVSGWVPGESYGSSAVTMTNANITLSNLEAAKNTIVISGLLVSNLNLIFPLYVKEWLVVNNCTGAFSITCKTASGSGVATAIGTSNQIRGDGVDILLASSSSGVTQAQIQQGVSNTATAGGTANALTGSFSPAITVLTSGTTLFLRAGSANTSATPTFQANGTSAAIIVKGNNLPLVAGDIAGAGQWLEFQYDGVLARWVLQNPATGISTVPAAFVKAWVNFNGTGVVAIRSSFNVTSITDNGTGDYTINFTIPMATANYCALISGRRSAVDDGWCRTEVFTTTSLRVVTNGAVSDNRADWEVVSVAIFG